MSPESRPCQRWYGVTAGPLVRSLLLGAPPGAQNGAGPLLIGTGASYDPEPHAPRCT